MAWKFNPFTLEMDYYGDSTGSGGPFVKIAGDTMTGELVITPTSGTTALTANLDIVLKAGQKLIFDGA